MTGNLEVAWSAAKIGDEIDVKMQDGRSIRTCIRDLERMRTADRRDAAILLSDNVRLIKFRVEHG